MFKQIAALLLLSVAVILATVYASHGVHWLLSAHDWVANLLTNVFTVGQAGNIARNLIALLSIPMLIALVPAMLFWMLRRHWFPYFMEIVWVVWLVQAGAILVMHT